MNFNKITGEHYDNNVEIWLPIFLCHVVSIFFKVIGHHLKWKPISKCNHDPNSCSFHINSMLKCMTFTFRKPIYDFLSKGNINFLSRCNRTICLRHVIFMLWTFILHDLDKNSSRSLRIISNKSLYTTSYSRFIVTMCLKDAILELRPYIMHALDQYSSMSLVIISNESPYTTSYLSVIVTICLKHVIIMLQPFILCDLDMFFFKVTCDHLICKLINDFLSVCNSNHMAETCHVHVTGLSGEWPLHNSWRSFWIMTHNNSHVDVYLLQISRWLNLPVFILCLLLCSMDHTWASQFAGRQIWIGRRRAKMQLMSKNLPRTECIQNFMSISRQFTVGMSFIMHP